MVVPRGGVDGQVRKRTEPSGSHSADGDVESSPGHEHAYWRLS